MFESRKKHGESVVIDLEGSESEGADEVESRPPPIEKRQDFMLIRDLYERITRFKLLCRVNHMIQFYTHKGKPCTKLMLIDEEGDEITCMLYEHSQDRGKSKPTVRCGRTYVFENGYVAEDHGKASLDMPFSGVMESKYCLPSFHPTKMKKIEDI